MLLYGKSEKKKKRRREEEGRRRRRRRRKKERSCVSLCCVILSDPKIHYIITHSGLVWFGLVGNNNNNV